MRLSLSANADHYLASILEYGTEKFGYNHAIQYYLKFLDVFDLIKLNPQIGHAGSGYLADYRMFINASHRIFYQLHDQMIIISRILHHSQDEIRHLNLN